MRNRKAFTLIELIAVLVILSIITLIVTPLVLNIIRKAKIVSNKRSIDAYGRSVEIALATYLLDNNRIPESFDDLNIEYKGTEVICETQKINSDASIYLSGCTVGGKKVLDYQYGKEEKQSNVSKTYAVGDIIEYNEINFYVIKDNAEKQSVTLLKAVSLTYEEIQIYSAGTEAKIVQSGDYGRMTYSLSTSLYDTSFVKHVVDEWTLNNISSNDLIIDSLGYKARLITFDELKDEFAYEVDTYATRDRYIASSTTPNWIYSNNIDLSYWTMSQYNDRTDLVWCVSGSNLLDASSDNGGLVEYSGRGVRPVITIKKAAL